MNNELEVNSDEVIQSLVNKIAFTQRCSECGNVKTGDDKVTLQGNKKHHTKHDEYVCYNCGSILDRDGNAVANLLDLIN